MSKIVDSCSLLTFAAGKRMQVGAFVNKDSGDTFKSCIFTDAANNKTFVAFSSKLGELSPGEIARRKHELQVVTFDTGGHMLCVNGSTW